MKKSLNKERRFVAFILTHGRPDRVVTYKTLKRAGYTGDIVFVLDNEDKTTEKYRKNFPNETIYVFDKEAESRRFDTADLPTARRNAIVYARNACFWIAKELGYTHFIQLDDDYTSFQHTGTYDAGIKAHTTKRLDDIFALMCDFLDSTDILTVAMAQGGDFIGGQVQATKNAIVKKRKAMNSFVCRIDRPFSFLGRINEDVNTYASASTGDIFLTTPEVRLNQVQTQSGEGGMTDIYEAQGTYVKSFYTVIFAPSAAKVGVLRDTNTRIHHTIDWNSAVPKIIRQEHKK